MLKAHAAGAMLPEGLPGATQAVGRYGLPCVLMPSCGVPGAGESLCDWTESSQPSGGLPRVRKTCNHSACRAG